MTAEGGTVLDQAIAWHLRLGAEDELGWTQFTEWLEASPDHAAAYDQVAMLDGELTESEALRSVELPPESTSANDNGPMPQSRSMWLVGGTGLAAAAVAAFALLPSLQRPDAATIYETPAGVSRSVALDDGSHVELGGGSRLRVTASATRMAVLERGEAVFHVRHRDRQPFTVSAGNVSVQDLGTVFAVARDIDAVRVGVAEGSVEVHRAGHKLTLGAGDTALASLGQEALAAGRVDPAAVGGWRTRTLTFQGEALGSVVERLNRLYALNIALGPNLSDRPFTGMVQLTGDAARDVPHLAALIGTAWRRDDKGWILSSTGSLQR